MSLAARTRIIKIGNSQGIRIPKALLQQLKLEGEVEIELRDDQLVVRRASQPRAGWDEKFRLMAQQHDDTLSDVNTAAPAHWDQDEWEW